MSVNGEDCKIHNRQKTTVLAEVTAKGNSVTTEASRVTKWTVVMIGTVHNPGLQPTGVATHTFSSSNRMLD